MSDDRLKTLLRSAFPPPAGQKPPRDIWPLIVNRIEAPAEWSWIEVCVAAGVVVGNIIALVLFPRALLLLAYHL